MNYLYQKFCINRLSNMIIHSRFFCAYWLRNLIKW